MYDYSATVVDVHDGDTITCNIDLGFKVKVDEIKFRLMGIDTPELSTIKGQEVRDFVQSLIKTGDTIRIQTVKLPKSEREKIEKYGRYMATVYLQGNEKSLNDMLLEKGLAVPYFGGKKES